MSYDDDDRPQRCQRCGAMAWEWLCWTHYEQWQAEAEAAERKAEAAERWAETRDRMADEQLDKMTARLERSGRF